MSLQGGSAGNDSRVADPNLSRDYSSLRLAQALEERTEYIRQLGLRIKHDNSLPPLLIHAKRVFNSHTDLEKYKPFGNAMPALKARHEKILRNTIVGGLQDEHQLAFEREINHRVVNDVREKPNY